MAERIQLPNGAFFPVKEGESKEQALAVAQQMYPDAFAAPVAAAPKQDTTGFKAAASAGATRLGGEFELLKGKLGLKSEAEAQKEYEAAQARAQQRFTPTEEGWTESPFLKFKETLGGSLPYMAAPAAAGLAALAAPVSVPVAAGLGLLGAGAVSTGQFTGSNLARQMETGKTLEEASLGKAAAAAVPQALIDTAAMALLPGVGKLFGSVGSKLTTEQAKAIASQTLGKAAMDYTAKTGMAMGREGITEVAQQTLERLQAGLNIADPEARKEYIESFIGGAVLGGAIAPVGRAFERGSAKSQAAKAEAEETRTARTAAAEQQRLAKEQQAAADEAAKKTPEYAMQVGQQYDTLLADFKARKTALKAPGKDATPVEKAEYADAQKALKDLNEQLKEVVPEYRRTAPIRAQAQEQARVAGMDPFDYMMEQAGEVTDRKIAPVEDTAYEDSGLAFRDPEAPAKPLSPEQYVADRIALAQDQLADVAPENYVEYLMQNPLMVDQVIKTRTKMPGLNRKETEFVLDSLKLQRKAQEEDRKSRGLQGTAASQQRIEAVDAEEQAALDQAEADRQAAAAEAAREDSLGAERFALQKMRTAFAGSVKDEDVLSTKVDRLVEALQKRDEGPAPAGRVVAGTASTPVSNADILRAQLAYASATENRQRASDLKKQLDALNEPDNERAAGDLEFGNAAKEAGIEGRLSKQAMQANRVTRLSNAQLGAYDRLADFVQRVRENDQGVSDARKKTLLSATEKLKDNVAGLALSEVEARRAQAGLPEMSTAEKAKLVGQISQTLTELVERGAGIFQKPVERKAQMRGTKIVMGAGDAKPQPLGRRVFNNYEVASQALREQMRNDIDTVGGFVPSEPTAPPPERKPQRVTPLLKPQRPGFSDRSTEAQFADALRRATSDEDRTLLTELQNKFKNLSPLAQEDALDQVRNVELRMPAKAEGRLKDELDDLRSAGVSDTGQAELFPGDSEKGVTRTTPKRFLALLDSSKVQKLRAMLAEENRVLAFQEKRAATLAKKAADEAAKTEAAEQKILASNARTPVQKAKDALSRLVGPESKVTQALQISKEIKKKREETRSRLRSMLSEIENAELRAKKQVADIQELLSFTENKLQEVTAASEFGAAPSMNDLALWTQARDNQANELKKAQKTLTAVQKSLTAAQATQARIVEDHAKDTISNALVNEGAKAQRKYDAAKAALEKAQTEENAALRVLSAEQARKAAARPTTEEQVLERLGPNAKVVGTERIYRDTSDPRVQARVNALRKNIASAEVNYDNAKQKGNTAGMESALRRIEVYHASVNKILNNAPMRREAQMTDAEVQRQEEFDRAQDRTSDATVERFEESAGVRLKMAERRTIASVRNVKSNRIETQIKQESVAAQEARVRQEERTGDYPARALEELAKARAERAEVQRQIDYIDNNPAAPRSEAKQRQTAARTAAVAKRKDIDARLKELMATQKEVVAEARLDTKAEKELRKERNRMVRSAGRLQEAVDADTDAASGMGSLFFSRGTPVNGLTGVELRSELDKAVGDEKTFGKKVSVFDTVQDFLDANKSYDGKIPFDAKGFVDPDTGRAYLFAENIAKGEGLGILLHEVGVHLGFRNFFNAAQFNAIAKTVRNWANAPANTLEGKIGRAAAKRAKDAGTSAAQMDDELIAYAVEEAVKAGVEPAGVKSGSAVANWLRMIVDAFNKALKTLGLAPEKLKVGDLVNMAYGAAQLELKGTWHGTAGTFTEFDHAYMSSGEGSQAFGWGTYRAERESVAQYYKSVAETKNSGRTLDVVNAWYDLPEIKKWNAEGVNKPLYKGMTFDEAVANWKKDKKANADVGAAIGVFENYHTEPYYKTEAEFRKAISDLLDQARDNARSAIQRAPTAAIKKAHQQHLSALERVSAEAFDYRADLPPTLLPDPPKGRLLRTLHGQPEEAFINLDAPVLDQSARVGDALRKVFDALTNKQKARFNREIGGDPNPSGKDVYDAFKLAIGSQKEVSELMASFGIAGNRFLDRPSRNQPVSDKSRYNYVDFLDKDQGAAIIASDINPIGPAEGLLFSRATPALDALADKIITQPKTFKEKLGSSLALEAEMQGVDMRAGLRDVLKAGATGMGDDKLFTQAMYNVLKADQKMPLIYTVMSNGPLETYRDDKGLIGVRSTNKNSAKDVYEAVAALPGKDAAQKDRLATAYMVAQRASNKGLEKLDVGALGVEEADLAAVLAEAKADPELRKGLEAVRTAYNAYNKGMIDFLATTGAIPKAVAKQLNDAGDYVPFYRVDSNGMAELVFSDDAMITIGDIRRQPYLAELKGGEQRILPLSEALPRNTILLTDKALTNMATKGVAYGLQSIGAAQDKMKIQRGKGPADPRTIRFNQEPDLNDPKDTGERWLRVDTEGTLAEGVPSELLVKSLEGAHLPLPGFLKLAGKATDFLRAGVTRTPLYLARQLIREPMAAAFTGGLNYNAFTAVLKGGMKFVQMTRGNTDAEAKLLEKGLIQSGIFTGDVDDMGKFALQLAGNNQSALERLYAATDRAAIRADAATRSLVYENALANGLSEVEADFMTMESMNFYKRGLSPSVQYASRMIPFFNAQIQGLNVLYKAATGKMPFEEQQQIKRKFFNNAVLMVASGIVYAMAMEDDETWRNARPRDKMTNFFIPLPGTDELLKLPIPFEAGYFYSLAVAAVDGMREQTDNKEQWSALKDLFINSIPGASSMGVPQLIKPIAEVWTNKNFMSGSEVESRRLQGLSTEERYNATTTELAKQMSKALPILSPIQIEHIVRGYLGVLPLAAAAAANGLFEGEGKGEKPEKRLSETALVGSAFQKKFGGADSDVVFRMAGDAMEARTTLNKMLNEGRREDAIAYREKNRVELQSASAAGQYRQLVGRINADLRRTQERTDLTATEKRARIDKLDEAKQQAAQRFATMVRRIEGAGE